MRNLSLFALMIGMLAFIPQADAQVVPYRVTGTGIGNLADLTAVGEAVGLHFGRLTFEVFDDGSDTQVAADGSELYLQNVGTIFFDTSDPDPDTGMVVTTLIDEWMIMGGSKRFASAAAVEFEGNYIISTTVTAPYDPAAPFAVPFLFQKTGKIDLGNKGKK